MVVSSPSDPVIETVGSCHSRLLDLTRLVRRACRVFTGIDRVEFAYLNHLIQDPVPLYGLVRSAYGYVILEPQAVLHLHQCIIGKTPFDQIDLLSRMRFGLEHNRARAEATVRARATSRALPIQFGRAIKQHLPKRLHYINVGQSNLSTRTLAGIKQALGAKISVFIHDTIPLDFPKTQRPETVRDFGAMLERVNLYADQVIVNSASTAADLARHMPGISKRKHVCIAHLGIDLPVADDHWPHPPGFDPQRPYFVTVGTIEPRKNHTLLLDLWEAMARSTPAQNIPQLLLIGARGWENHAVFRRLDALPKQNPTIFETGNLSDSHMAAALRDARAALFPSIAEGFGLPVAEALSLGTPVVANDLPLYREVFGQNVTCLDRHDFDAWLSAISQLSAKPHEVYTQYSPPNWSDHVNSALRIEQEWSTNKEK